MAGRGRRETSHWPAADGAIVILFRTQDVDAPLAAFAAQLRDWSGMPVAFIVDERKGVATVPDWAAKVSLSERSCRELGLYCPKDFAWRCGDYGLYLARHANPDVDRFWLIENDVRITGTDPADFFAFFAARDEDFLASYIGPAPTDWYWHDSLLSRDRTPHKCFFPLCRISARALDGLLAARQSHSCSWSRRRFWPNDEGFVATGLIGDGFACADFNDFGRRFYDTSAFHFETIADGDALPACQDAVCLLHPVLYGDALARKRARLLARHERPSALARLGSRLDRKLGLSAIARRRNAARDWHDGSDRRKIDA